MVGVGFGLQRTDSQVALIKKHFGVEPATLTKFTELRGQYVIEVLSALALPVTSHLLEVMGAMAQIREAVVSMDAATCSVAQWKSSWSRLIESTSSQSPQPVPKILKSIADDLAKQFLPQVKLEVAESESAPGAASEIAARPPAGAADDTADAGGHNGGEDTGGGGGGGTRKRPN